MHYVCLMLTYNMQFVVKSCINLCGTLTQKAFTIFCRKHVHFKAFNRFCRKLANVAIYAFSA